MTAVPEEANSQVPGEACHSVSGRGEVIYARPARSKPFLLRTFILQELSSANSRNCRMKGERGEALASTQLNICEWTAPKVG